MAKKDSKLATAAHIKRHTEGTSNELSFSVLDAKKNQADVEEGKDDKVQSPRFGGLPIFSWRPGKKRSVATPTKEQALPLTGEPAELPANADLHTASPEPLTLSTGSQAERSYGSPEDEIVRRKHQRRRKRVVAAVVGIAVAVALLGGGGYFVYTEVTNHQEQVGVLEQSLDKIEQADKTILAIDEVLAVSWDAREEATMNKLLNQISSSKEYLNEAEKLAHTSLDNMRDVSEKSVAEQSLVAIDSRKEMLDSAETLLEASIQAQEDTKLLAQAWEKVLRGDELAREAASIVTATTPENVTTSRDKSAEAKAAFEEAQFLTNELSSSFLNLEIQKLQGYIAKRIEASGYSIASDEAILAQNRQVAEEQNAAYNAADAEASALAREIPEDTKTIIDQAYEIYTEEKQAQYSDMRLSASTADAFLRDYLGTSSK
ncbi:MAG: hypothetical protein ACOYD7_03480 [Raoultibacter sp.]|jgi:hypothetical protein